MATGKYAGKDTFFLVDGYNLIAAKLQQLRWKILADQEETQGLGDGWGEKTPTGMQHAELEQQGAFFDTSTNNIHAAMSGSIGSSPQATPRIACAGAAGSVIGNAFRGFSGLFTSMYEVLSQAGKLTRANAAYDVTGTVERGTILHALTAETAAANTEASSVDYFADTAQVAVAITSSSVANPTVITTPVPHGRLTGDVIYITGHSGATPSLNSVQYTITVISSTTFSLNAINVTVGGTGGSFVVTKTNNGGSAYLQVTALTLGGYDSATVTLRASTNNSTFVDLVAFAVTTTAPSAQRVTVAGAVLRYLAQNVAFQGSGSGPSITYMAGFCRS